MCWNKGFSEGQQKVEQEKLELESKLFEVQAEIKQLRQAYQDTVEQNNAHLETIELLKDQITRMKHEEEEADCDKYEFSKLELSHLADGNAEHHHTNILTEIKDHHNRSMVSIRSHTMVSPVPLKILEPLIERQSENKIANIEEQTSNQEAEDKIGNLATECKESPPVAQGNKEC